MQANKQTDERVAQYSMSLFLNHSAHRATPSGVLGEGPELGSCTQTQLESDPWLRVELAPEFQAGKITKIRIFNREDCCHERLHDFEVRVGNNSDINKNPICYRWKGGESGILKAINLMQDDYKIGEEETEAEKDVLD